MTSPPKQSAPPSRGQTGQESRSRENLATIPQASQAAVCIALSAGDPWSPAVIENVKRRAFPQGNG